MNKTAIVTGGSSGIGLAIVKALLESGCTVYEFSRHEGADCGAIHITADVSDPVSVENAVAEVIKVRGRIDVLVNNAGFGISGAAEFTDNETAGSQLDVNLFGTVNMIKAAVPYMRAEGRGRIVNLSSVAAEVPIPFQAWYSVSKAAINSYTTALRGELSRFGISVCAVMPGDTKTGFTASRRKEVIGDAVYDGAISRSVAVMEHDEQTGMPAEKAGRFIARVALAGKVRPLYTIGIKNKVFVALARILPKSLSSRIVNSIYAG